MEKTVFRSLHLLQYFREDNNWNRIEQRGKK